jgi:hypothetical protein
MLDIYYVYLLLDPLKFYQPFYIGKGKDKRASYHLKEKKDRTDNLHKYNTIQKIRNQGLEPAIMIWADNLSEDQAYDLEESLIQRFGRRQFDQDGILTNICISNRPPSAKGRKYDTPYSESRRQKIGAANQGFNPNKKAKSYEDYLTKVERCKSMTEKRVKEGKHRTDYTVTEETRKKQSIAKTGKVCKDRNNMWGKKHKPESIELMRQNRQPKVIKDEVYHYVLTDPQGGSYTTKNLFYFGQKHSLNSRELRRISKPENHHRRHKGWAVRRQ